MTWVSNAVDALGKFLDNLNPLKGFTLPNLPFLSSSASAAPASAGVGRTAGATATAAVPAGGITGEVFTTGDGIEAEQAVVRALRRVTRVNGGVIPARDGRGLGAGGDIPIGPGPESVRILLWAADARGGRWDTATWDGATWSAPGWQSVGCDVRRGDHKVGGHTGERDPPWRRPASSISRRSIRSGARSAQHGAPVLRGREAGNTDPDRRRHAGGARGGERLHRCGHVFARGRGPDPRRRRDRRRSLGTGARWDRAPEYAPSSHTGDHRGGRPIGARARGAGGGDGSRRGPPVAPYDGKRAGVAAHQQCGARCAVFVRADPTGMSVPLVGRLPDAALLDRVCSSGRRSRGRVAVRASTIEATAAGMRSAISIRADSAGTTGRRRSRTACASTYGPRPFDVQRVVPDRATWAGRILADRGDAGLEVEPRIVMPIVAPIMPVSKTHEPP